MNAQVQSSGSLVFFLAVIFTALSVPCAVPAEPVAVPVNGFYVNALPADNGDLERFLSGLRNTGATHILLQLPLRSDGHPDVSLLSNTAYLVHQAGLRIAVIIPTRRLPGLIAEHGDWEDRSYDPATASVRRSGLIDLFRPEAVAYLERLAKTVAAYAIDGILLGSDFRLSATDGLGPSALASAKRTLGRPVRPKEMFLGSVSGEGGPVISKYGDRFPAWASLKRDQLADVFAAVQRAARSVKPAITVGVHVPLVLPVSVPEELLARYSFDVKAFRRLGADHYWTVLDHQETTVRQAQESISRSACAAMTMVRDPERLILVVPSVNASGGALPLAEIEEATELVRQSGRSGIAYMIAPGAVPPGTFTSKLFKMELKDEAGCRTCDANAGSRMPQTNRPL